MTHDFTTQARALVAANDRGGRDVSGVDERMSE